MNIRAAAMAATAAFALAALGAGPAFADNHSSVAPQGLLGPLGEQGAQYLQGDQGPQFLQDGAYEH
ncbi:hypothetical protein OG898_35050 [Streptomyces sp. NBC_00193]|uniref:hypothetical protein n=1 Tax=Streptomyces sp. NBC_00193 TaxID=2975675 RepID=UPI002256CCAB|nr:hypothetical protein [Streptomyces sp. NBC_00193]MCX5301627.1 hypothetical protein [Streptomyces sp. NBC_00193]